MQFVTEEILNYNPEKTGYDFALHIQHGFYTTFFDCVKDPSNQNLIIELACWSIFFRNEFPSLYENSAWIEQYRIYFSEEVLELALDRLFGGVPKERRIIQVNVVSQ